MKRFWIMLGIIQLIDLSLMTQTFEFGGQLRLRFVAEENFRMDSIGAPAMRNVYDFRQRSRFFSIARYSDVAAMFEIENNSRWGFRTNTPNESSVHPQQTDETGEVYINNVFVDFPVPFASKLAPVFARVGRQYFQLGRGLVIDVDSDDAPDPLDGVRLYSPLQKRLGFDLLYAIKKEDPDRKRRRQEIFGAILHVGFNKSPIASDQYLHPYTFYQRDRSNSSFQDNRIFSGIYLEGQLPYFMNIFDIDRIKYRAEYSHQYGSVDSASGNKVHYNANAFYFDFNVRRDFTGGLKLKLKGTYFISTGDNPQTPEIELFRSNFQNYRPGELFGEEVIGSSLIRNLYPDGRFGRGGSNIQILRGEVEFEFKDIEISFEYFNYLANKVPDGISNRIGNELDVELEYKFTNKLNSHLKLARFWPGLFFGRNLKTASEVEFEIKLNF